MLRYRCIGQNGQRGLPSTPAAAHACALIWLAVALGLSPKSVETASNTAVFLILLPFLGGGFVPTTMPEGLRQFATNQPFTPVTDTIRELLTGAAVGDHAIVPLTWSCAVAFFSYLWAIRLYTFRRAATPN